LSPQCGDNFAVGESTGKADHVGQIASAVAAPVFGGQFSRHCLVNVLSVGGALVVEDFRANPPAHAPIEHGDAGVDVLRYAGAGLLDQGAQVAQEGLHGLLRRDGEVGHTYYTYDPAILFRAPSEGRAGLARVERG
jgi:hypothetical protein